MAHLAPARELLGHDDAVMSVAWSPNGAHLASASVDRTVRVWETSSGRMLVCCQGHTGEIRDVAFSPDGARLASVGYDRTVRLWEAASGLEQAVWRKRKGPLQGVTWSPDGKRLAVGCEDHTVRVWRVSTGRLRCTCRDHPLAAKRAAWSPDGARLAMAADQTVRVLEVSSRQELGHLPGPYPASPGGDLVACWPIPGFGQRGSHHPALGGDAWRLA